MLMFCADMVQVFTRMKMNTDETFVVFVVGGAIFKIAACSCKLCVRY